MLELSQIDVLNPRGITAILLAIGAIALIIYAIGHSGKGIVFSLLLLVGVGALGYFEYQYQSEQAQGTAAIQKVYQNANLKLHCERFSESLTASDGTRARYESANPGSVWVANADCGEFLNWVGSDHTSATTAQAQGVYAVAAETARVGGIADVCVPITAMSQLATALGASPSAAAALTTDYYNNVWSKTAGNPGCSIVGI